MRPFEKVRRLANAPYSRHLDEMSDRNLVVHTLTSGRLHYLVNNSGISYYTPILDLDLVQVRNTFETNVISMIALTQAFFPLLRAAQGTVVNNASSGGVDTSYLPFSAAYNSSKSAAAKLSQTMRLELEPFGVKVVTLYAGGVETKLWDNLARSGNTKLKTGSLYEPIKQEAENILGGDFIENSPLEPWAVGVVTEITKASPPREVWSGKLSSTVWWLNFLAPRWLVDYAFSAQTGLSKLKGRLEQQKVS